MPDETPEEVIQGICKILWPHGRDDDDAMWEEETCESIADLLAANGYGRPTDPNECDQCDGTGLCSEGRLLRANHPPAEYGQLLKKYPCPYCTGTSMILRAQGKNSSS